MEKYRAKIMVGNFNTNTHYTRVVEFEASGREGIDGALKEACRKVVAYNAVWWLMSLEMVSERHFLDSFN